MTPTSRGGKKKKHRKCRKNKGESKAGKKGREEVFATMKKKRSKS